jgi:hypothetical protein
VHRTSHLVRWYFFFCPSFCQKKSRHKSLNFLSTSFGTSKNDNIIKGTLLRMEYNNINLPPTESNFLFQLLRCFWNLSKACFQSEFVSFFFVMHRYSQISKRPCRIHQEIVNTRSYKSKYSPKVYSYALFRPFLAWKNVTWHKVINLDKIKCNPLERKLWSNCMITVEPIN